MASAIFLFYLFVVLASKNPLVAPPFGLLFLHLILFLPGGEFDAAASAVVVALGFEGLDAVRQSDKRPDFSGFFNAHLTLGIRTRATPEGAENITVRCFQAAARSNAKGTT